MKRAKKDRESAVLREKILAASDGLGLDAKDVLIAVEQWAAAAIADREAQVVSERSCAHADHDDVRKLQFLTRVGKEAGEQKDRFSRHGDTGIFEKQAPADRPVAILGDQVAQEVEDVLPHGGNCFRYLIAARDKAAEDGAANLGG